MKKLFLLFCLAMVACMTMAEPHYWFDHNFPLYSRQNDAEDYRIGGTRYTELDTVWGYKMRIHDKIYSVPESAIECEVSKDEKWVKLKFKAGGRTRTAYTPIKYVKVEYYERPKHRNSDGLATYELTADTEFKQDYTNYKTTLPAGEVVIVMRFNDNGSVVCEYAGHEWFSDNGDHLVPTDKPYKYTYPLLSSPTVGGFLGKFLAFAAWLLPTIVVAIILSRIYVKRYREKGEIKRALDYAAAILLIATTVLLYFAYEAIIHRSIFEDMFAFSMHNTDWWLIAIYCCLVVIAFNIIMATIIRFSMIAPRIMTIWYGIMTLVVTWNALSVCFIFPWYRIIISALAIFYAMAYSYFIGAKLIALPDRRCNVCNASDWHIVEQDFDGNLYKKDRHGKPISIEYIEHEDIKPNKQYTCKRCGHEWIVFMNTGYSKVKYTLGNKFTDCSTIQLMHE